MTKKIIYPIILGFSGFFCGQEIMDTISYKIPYLGKEGGQHIVNMNLDKNSDEIVINAYSNVKGGQLIANPKDIAEAKKEHGEKGFFGKMLSSIGQSNSYQYVVLPIAQENRINYNTKKKSNKEEIFYTADNVPAENNVYYIPSIGMVDLSFRFNEGYILKHRYDVVGNVFTTFPKLGTVLLNFGNIEYKGEGIIGMKNLRPKIVEKQGKFDYNSTKGFVSDAISNEVADAIELIGDQQCKFISNSNNIYKTYTYSWYNNEETNEYKLLVYDIKTKEKKILNFNFENSRDPKVLNKSIYDENNNKVGYLSIFGFDKRQDKKKKLYAEQQFNFVVTDLEGNILYNKLVDYGDGKSYKQILMPTYVVRRDNGNLYFPNINMQSIFKGNTEFCELDVANNTLTASNQQGLILNVGDKKINVSRIFEDYDEVFKYNNGYVFLKSYKESDPNTKVERIKGFDMTITDQNLIPRKVYVNKEDFPRVNTLPIKFYKIDQTGNNLVFIDRQGSYFGITKIENDIISHTAINTPYKNSASLENFYGYFNQEPFLLDKEKRMIYLVDQYYIKVDNSVNVIDRIGITKIRY